MEISAKIMCKMRENALFYIKKSPPPSHSPQKTTVFRYSTIAHVFLFFFFFWRRCLKAAMIGRKLIVPVLRETFKLFELFFKIHKYKFIFFGQWPDNT